MGFSVRLAPGVRVRASSRGIRTSIGPRAARVHVGGGRPGISTGVGPIGFYQSLGGTRRPAPRASASAAGRSLAEAKAGLAAELRQAISEVQNLHRQTFPQPSRPVAPPAELVDPSAILRRHRKAARAGVPWWDFRARSQAKVAADAATAREAAQEKVRREQLRTVQQGELDARWTELLDNDPACVLEVLTGAFEDNDAPAAALGCVDGVASIVVLVPDVDVIPDRYPTTTQAGNLSLKRMTKTDQAALYRTMVAGYLLVTAKEAFAVAPRLVGVRCVAIRVPRRDAYGSPVVEALVGCHFSRSALSGVRWADTDAATVLVDASDELVYNAKGSTKALAPIALDSEPDLAALVARVDVDHMESAVPAPR